MYYRILVPTNGSDHSAAAARRALDVAGVHGATVHAVFVVDTDTGWPTVSTADVRESLRDVGRDEGDRVRRAVGDLVDAADVELVTSVLEGTPTEEMLRSVAEHDVDLVVVGTHGRTGIEERLLGSDTGRVVGAADVPVLVTTLGGANA